MMGSIKQSLEFAGALLRLYFKGRRPAVGFDVMSIGELQFFRDVLNCLVKTHPDILIFFFHHEETRAALSDQLPIVKSRFKHLRYSPRTLDLFTNLDLYITTEQFVPGPPSVYTLTLFHGQPSKGVTFKLFNLDPLLVNDAMFLYGPLQKQALKEHLDYWGLSLPSHLDLFEVGYTKSDRLINGLFDRMTVLEELGLDQDKKTIMYAPAFNQGASMQEAGKEILSVLCRLNKYNVIAKLPIDCQNPGLVGGIDWYTTLSAFERNFSNFKLMRNLEIDPGLAASDVLITCVSSVGFEFLALKRPVIYFDTPKFFRETLSTFFPGHDLSSWADRTVVNGGREFGIVVSHTEELPAAIEEVLADSYKYPKRKSELPHCLIYNPGKATEAAVKQIASLLALRVRSRRPYIRRSLWVRALGKARRSLQCLMARILHGAASCRAQ
jgi:hypothetical protein